MDKVKRQIIDIGKKLGDKGYSPGTSGNVSVRVGDYVYVTASGTCLGMLELEDISVINLQGDILDGQKPSSEFKMHLKIYDLRSDLNAIIHYHSPKSTAFSISHTDISFPALAENIFHFGEIPMAEYFLAGSNELANETSKFFKKHNVVLMKNHGAIIGAKTLKEAYLKVQTLEATAETLIYAKILGGAKPLNNSQIQEVIELRKSCYK